MQEWSINQDPSKVQSQATLDEEYWVDVGSSPPIAPSEFYNEVWSIVASCSLELEHESPILFPHNWERRKAQLEALERELTKAEQSYCDITLEILVRRIVAERQSWFFGRTELPTKLRGILQRLDQGSILINKLGNRTNQDLQQENMALRRQINDLVRENHDLMDNFNALRKKLESDHQEKIRKIQQRLTEKQQLFSDTVIEYQEKLASQRAERETALDTKNQFITAYQRLLKRKDEEHADLTKILYERDCEIEMLQRENEGFQKELHTLRARVGEIQASCEDDQSTFSLAQNLGQSMQTGIGSSGQTVNSFSSASESWRHSSISTSVPEDFIPDFEELTRRFESFRK